MHRLPNSLLIAVAAALTVAGCAGGPTSPTPVTGGLVVAQVAQETPSVPTALIPTPPNAVGAARFLAFGDSITCGTPSPVFSGLVIINCNEYGYPERLLAMLQTYSPGQAFTVTKRGLPGEGAFEGERRLASELSELAGPSVPIRQRPEVLLLLEGINDMTNGASPTRAAASVAQMVQIARLFNLTVFVATMPQTYHSVDPTTGRVRENAAQLVPAFNTEIRRLAAQNVVVVDLYAAFGTNRSLMGDDGLHPTPAGYNAMAQQFHAAIVQQFPVRGGVQ
jgi:lysophospholipase L1-like esterase